MNAKLPLKRFSRFIIRQRRAIAFIPVTYLFVFPVQAELMGLVPGRGADVSRFANKSVEVGVSQYSDQLLWSALRFNIKPVRHLAVYIDVAHVESFNLPLDTAKLANFQGVGIGGGLIFSVPDGFNRLNVAFKSAFHQSTSGGQLKQLGDSLSAQQEQLNLHQSQWSAGFVVSPIDPLYENGFSWFANVSYSSTQAQTVRVGIQPLQYSTRVPYRGESGMTWGVGIVQPLSGGSVFAGIDWVADNTLLSAGYRHTF